MRLADLLGPDLKQALTEHPAELEAALSGFHAEDIAEILDDLPLEDAIALMRALPTERGADVVECLRPARQVALLRAVDVRRAVALLGEMAPDDRVDIMQELSEEEAAALLVELSVTEPEAAAEVRELVVYAPETAGGLMTTEYVALSPETKTREAIEEVRRLGQESRTETLYYIYVCHHDRQLLGVLSLRDLLLSDPSRPLADVMKTKVVRASLADDQEQVANVIARYDLAAVPVVDDHGRLLGVVTVDDVVDVVIEEATEDAQMMGGTVPLEDAYFATRWHEFVWKRGAWLVVLFLGQMLTATVMEHHQGMLQSTLSLLLFIPLIISSGGNAGSQSSTLIIRAMAIGELAPKDWFRVFLRELGIGLALGVLLGGIGFLRAYGGEAAAPLQIGITVGFSILAIVVLSSIVGSLLPLLIKRVGLDPAVSSTPFIASVVDVLGLMVYFSVANVILNVLLPV